MHNWRFLLLAFVAVIQPIASFEPGLVDGRQQRCDYRTASVLRDPGVHFHGTYRFTKPLRDRRLNQREDIRRNEVREESLRTTSLPERRIVDTFENRGSSPTRFLRSSRADNRLARDAVDLRRETRGAELRIVYPTERNHEVEQKHLSSLPSARETRVDSRLYSNKLTEDENRSSSRRASASRGSMESRRDTQRNQDTTESQRVLTIQATRIASNRARDDVNASSRKERRIARERVQMHNRWSEFGAQQARKADHRVPERRSRNIEFRSSSVSSARTYNNEDLRLATHADTQLLDHDQRRNMQFRRTLDGQNRQRDTRITHRDIVLTEERVIRESSDRTRDVRTLQPEHTFEQRIDSRQRDAQLLGHDRFVENRNAGRNRDSRLTRAARFEAHRTSQDLRRDSRISKRERTAESRRDARDTRLTRSMDRNVRSVERAAINRRDSQISEHERTAENQREARDTRVTRSMERNLRPVERAAENRRDSRLADHERITENRREIQNTVKESRTVMQNRAVDIKREVRSIERDSREIKAGKITRYSCSSNREGSTERRMPSRNVERVVSRILTTERDTVNQKNAQNVEKASPTLGLERTADNRNIDRESRILERDRMTQSQINIRMNLRKVGSADRVRSLEGRRNDRNAVIHTVRVEPMNRGDARNFERFSLSADRRNFRNNKLDARTFEQKQSSETRDKRNTFIHEMSREGQQHIRNVEKQSQTVEEKRIINNQRDTRTLERNSRSLRRERSAETRRDIKHDELSKMFLFENKRERDLENRREMRNIERNSRAFRSEEEKRVESRITNMARARDSHSTERKNHRGVLQRLNIRDNRHSQSVSRESSPESRRMTERSSMELERREFRYQLNAENARKREFLSMIRNPAHAESETSAMNWQYLFYALQGLYISGILAQSMKKNSAKKSRALFWWTARQHLIKVD